MCPAHELATGKCIRYVNTREQIKALTKDKDNRKETRI
jgi:hypothetical protein